VGTASGDILVVDDNAANLIAIEAALGNVGGRVVRAQSGNEALRLLLQRDFALILLDVKMPLMDGLETARIIRSRRRSSHTPIMFLTAHGRDDADVLAAYQLGAVDFLFKPVIPEVLRAKVAVFVELQRQTAEVASQAALIREHERREHERALGEERSWWEAETLRRQMADLEEADRRKDHFLAVLGHELRNPLAPIVTGLELLRRKFEELSVRDEVSLRTRDSMERQALHLTRLVDDLLDISRINSGKFELQKGPIAIQEVIEQAIATSQPAIDQKRHRLLLDLPADPIMVHGDLVRLVQVVANLLNNAARYTEPCGEIEIQCKRKGGSVQVQVIDNGRGIAPNFVPKLFDMFSQEHPSAGTGLGLGLTVVKRIVNMHQGSVAVRPRVSTQGSEFTIELPIMTAPKPESLPVKSAAQPAQDDSGRADAVGPPLRVVLVEDNDDIREIMQELLAVWGHKVEVASDGIAGAELILKLRPDVALIDIGLPHLDGYGVATRVRSQLVQGTIKLVAMTGFGQDNDRKRAKDAGFDAHLVKPPDVGALQRILAS
jgi:two-component system, sensor histidine kinase